MNRPGGEAWLIGVGLVLFIGLAIWMTLGVGGGEEYFPPMSTYSPRPAGTKALYELCQAAGMRVERFHNSEYDYPPGACVVVLDSPDTSFSPLLGSGLDVRALRLWLEDGGRLVLFSDPMRATGGSLFVEIDESLGLEPYGELLDWNDLFGAEGEPGRELDGKDADENLYELEYTVGPEVRAVWEGEGGGEGNPGALWRIYEAGLRSRLGDNRPALWRDLLVIETAWPGYLPYVRGEVLLANSDLEMTRHNANQDGSASDGYSFIDVEPVVLYRRVGRGELIWVPRYEIACNSWLGRADNHRLVLALLAYAARGEGFYIDEHLHGYRHRQATITGMLFSTTGGRLILLLTVAALMLFAGAAVRPARYLPQPTPMRRQATEMVLAQGDLYRRAGVWRNVAASLVDGVRRTYAGATRSAIPPTREQLTDWLDGLQGSAILPVDTLLAYVRDDRILSARELLQLARECDAIRRHLHRGR